MENENKIFKKLENFLKKQIKKGLFHVKKHEIVFPLKYEEDIYIYRYGNKYRVMIPSPFEEGKKYHIGYFSTFEKAKNARDSVLKAINLKILNHLFKKLNK